MQNTTKFVGLDVSKEAIAVALADAGRGVPRLLGNIENTPEASILYRQRKGTGFSLISSGYFRIRSRSSSFDDTRM